MTTHPGRVERVGRMSGSGSPALAGSLPYHNHLKEGRGRGRGGHDGRTSRRCPGRWLLVDRWRCGGDVVAIASPRSGRGSRPSLSLLADTSGRSGELLEMVWTVAAADGTEEKRGTGEDGGGILRPGSLSSCFVCSFALPYLTT